jgi:hypothetical protein
MRPKKAREWRGWFASLVLAVFLGVWTGGIAIALELSPPSRGDLAQNDIEGLALRWFENMRTGNVDRSELTAEYSRHLTDDAIRDMSTFLRKYEYGAEPLGAELLLKRAGGKQTFYIVKIAFPRGDAASLMFGFDPDGKITGVNLMSMAGD